ncbi:MAG: TonB-dependent receptor, partial [Tunicatimonas sp.]
MVTSCPVLAQSLSGTVRDARTEEPLIGATIRLEGTDIGAVTDVKGFYQLENISAQTYNVSASYVGYKPATRFNVVVRSGGNPALNFDLSEALDSLGEVVVLASPFERSDDTPNSIQRLSQEEIATYPGGNNDIARVVQSLPGVSGSVGFRNDVIIRGGAPNENVYYLDGVEIPNINHFATQGSAGGPVGLLNVSFIEGVTLNSSAFPAQYDNVLSGVLQFDQRTGNPQERRLNFRLGASEAAVTYEGPLLRLPPEDSLANTTFIVSVRRSYLQFLFQLIDLPFLPDYWDYQYKINHKIDEYNEINLIGIGSLDNFQINPPDEATPEQQAVLDQVPVIQQWTSTVGVSWRRRFRNGRGFFRTTLSGNILNNDFRRYADNVNETGELLRNESVEDENKLRFELTNFINDWTISSGF